MLFQFENLNAIRLGIKINTRLDDTNTEEDKGIERV